ARQLVPARFDQHPNKRVEKMQVVFCRWQEEGVDGESAFLHAHLQVTASKKPRKTFVPAAQIKDDRVGAVFLQVREKKIQQEALSCAGCPKNDGVRVLLIM